MSITCEISVIMCSFGSLFTKGCKIACQGINFWIYGWSSYKDVASVAPLFK